MFGRLDIVVANAATVTPRAAVDVLSLDHWRDALDVNLTGAFLLCKHAVPHLRAQGSGSVILTASQMGRVAYDGQAAYCATKGALIQLAKVMALDHAQEGIRVNTLSPGRDRDGAARRTVRIDGAGRGRVGADPPRRPPWPAGGDRGCGGVPGERRVLVHDRRGSVDRRGVQRAVGLFAGESGRRKRGRPRRTRVFGPGCQHSESS